MEREEPKLPAVRSIAWLDEILFATEHDDDPPDENHRQNTEYDGAFNDRAGVRNRTQLGVLSAMMCINMRSDDDSQRNDEPSPGLTERQKHRDGDQRHFQPIGQALDNRLADVRIILAGGTPRREKRGGSGLFRFVDGLGSAVWARDHFI